MRDASGPEETGSLDGAWRLPVLNACLWINAALGTMWLSVALFAFPGLASSLEFYAVLPGLAGAWLGALFRRWPEKIRVGLLLFFCLDGAAAVAGISGLRPGAVVLAAIFVLVATLYFGRKGGLASIGTVMLVYGLIAVGWVQGALPLSAIAAHVEYSQLQAWLSGGLVVLLGLAAISTIVTYVLAHATQSLRSARESEEKFSKAFRASPDPIVISEAATGLIIDINEACERLFGIPRDRAVGRTSLEMGLWPDPQERARLAALLARDGSVRGFQCRGRKADGTISIFEAAVERIELGGRACLVGLVHDITEQRRAVDELRESEAKLRAMFASSRDAIGVSKNGVHIFANPAYLSLFGFESNGQIVGTSIFESIAPSHRQEMTERAQRRAAGLPVPSFYEARARKIDGTEFDAEFSVSTYELNGEIYSLVHIRDITERRRAEDARARLEGQLRQAQKMEAIGRLAGGIAHDFNNILTAIIGNAQLAEAEAPADHPVRPYLGSTLLAAKRAKELVKQILAFSRQQELQRGPVQLEDVVRDSLKLLRPLLPATIEIELNLPDLAPAILGDTTQLNQILLNLATNAAHAMEGRAGRLVITVDEAAVDLAMASEIPQLKPGRFVRLSVADTGCGMDEKTLQRLYEPFFTSKERGQGTGLGLAVVHGIVQQHNAEITVESAPGQGSTFRLFFPVASSAAVAAAARPASVAPFASGQRLLVVDDDEMVLSVATKILARAGYRPAGFGDPTAALQAFRADPARFDLVFSDMTMPGLTGTQLAVEIHKIRPDIPTVLTTGYGDRIDPDAVEAAGLARMLPKPYTSESLLLAMGKALEAASRLQPKQ